MINAPANFTTANAALAKKPVYLFTINGYARHFTNYATGFSGHYPWITDMADLSISVSDLDGGADLSTLSVVVQDRNGLITADWPTALFEGKTCTFSTGFQGMAVADYATLFTGVIDTVDTTDGNLAYVFNCISNDQLLQKVIYATGDDGYATSSTHPKTVVGHPLDIMSDILINQVGLTADQVNQGKLGGYRDTIYAGLVFEFTIESPPVAKDFIEQQLLQELGGYLWVNSLGQFDVNFFYPSSTLQSYGGQLMGGWANGSGQIVGKPIIIGANFTGVAPVGATQLLMGINDNAYGDNTGSFSIDVNGSSYSVGANQGPYSTSGGLNSAFPYNVTTFTGTAGAPTSVPVTAGNTYVVRVTAGAVYLHGGGFGPSNGDGWFPGGPVTSVSSGHPGWWASPKTVFRTPVATLNVSNTVGDQQPLATTAPLCNVISWRFDKTSGSGSKSSGFNAEEVLTYNKSIARFGSFGDGQMYGQHIIESDGARSGFQGYYLGSFVARLIFLRYGLKNLTYDVTLFWSQCVLEPGDLVTATFSHMPDRQAGVVGISGRLMEVMDRDWNFRDGTVTLKLLDASYLSQFGGSLIAPTGEANYTSASSGDKAKYMFLCNNSDQYSNGDAGHALG